MELQNEDVNSIAVVVYTRRYHWSFSNDVKSCTCRLLEEDQRCHTKIIFRSGSVPSLPDSVVSADSSSSVRMATCIVNTEVITSEEASLEPQEEDGGEEKKGEVFEEDRGDSGGKENQGESEGRVVEGRENQQEPCRETYQEGEKKRERSGSDDSKSSKDSEQTSRRSWFFRDDSRGESSPIFGKRAQPPEEEKERTEEELWHLWSSLMTTWEESFKRQHKLIRQLVRQGIPAHLRGMAWQLLADAHHQELKQQYPRLITVS